MVGKFAIVPTKQRFSRRICPRYGLPLSRHSTDARAVVRRVTAPAASPL